MKNITKKTPLWILVILGLLGVMGVGISINTFFNPSSLADMFGTEVTNVIAYSWAIRNIAAALVVLVAVALRKPQYVLMALLVRLFTEIGDTILAFATGNTQNGIMFGVFIILEIVMIFKVKQILCAKEK